MKDKKVFAQAAVFAVAIFLFTDCGSTQAKETSGGLKKTGLYSIDKNKNILFKKDGAKGYKIKTFSASGSGDVKTYALIREWEKEWEGDMYDVVQTAVFFDAAGKEIGAMPLPDEFYIWESTLALSNKQDALTYTSIDNHGNDEGSLYNEVTRYTFPGGKKIFTVHCLNITMDEKTRNSKKPVKYGDDFGMDKYSKTYEQAGYMYYTGIGDKITNDHYHLGYTYNHPDLCRVNLTTGKKDTLLRRRSAENLMFNGNELIVDGNVKINLALYPKTGTITGQGVRLRDKPNLNGKVLVGFAKGAKVTVLAGGIAKQKIGELNDFWYSVQTVTGEIGYVFGGYLKID